MIHTASLVHDDVLDEADTRRGGWHARAARAHLCACVHARG
jgi:geranylgeranyl pyrophosphate synthase